MPETENESPENGAEDQSPEMIRREFIKRFGVYAAGAGVGLFILMSPRTSKASASDGM